MEFNNMQNKAIEVSGKLKTVFGNRIKDTQIYDIVDETDHHSFKIRFLVYNYFSVVFQYELDIIGCYIESGNNACISLLSEKYCYSDTNIEDYALKLKDELELRIPDKYLKAKGWL